MLDDTSMEVVRGMLFLTFSDADIRFAEKELVEGVTQLQRALFITKRVVLINRKGFAATMLDENEETVIVSIVISIKFQLHQNFSSKPTLELSQPRHCWF